MYKKKIQFVRKQTAIFLRYIFILSHIHWQNKSAENRKLNKNEVLEQGKLIETKIKNETRFENKTININK